MRRNWMIFLFIAGCVSCVESKKSQVDLLSEISSDLSISESEGDSDTPINLAEHDLPKDLKLRPWVATNYENQESALGWKSDSFQIPDKLKVPVDFWYDIYTKYNSWQGVLHDSKFIDLVYGEVDFTSIMQDKSLSYEQKLKARRKHVEGLKKALSISIGKMIEGKELTDAENLLKKKIESKLGEKADVAEWKLLDKDGRLRFQLGQKDYIQRGFIQSGAYMKQIEKIFQEHGLPLELTRIVFVESSFNLKARSKVGASGVWQIMPSTAKGKGLSRSYYYDYRNHPLAAAHAAAKLLKFNYRILENWPLALTGYNYGAPGIRRLANQLRATGIEDLIDYRGGRWGFAAANFYASYLAVMKLEREIPKIYGTNFQIREEMKQEPIRLKTARSLKQVQSLFSSAEDFYQWNPQFHESKKAKDFILRKGLSLYVPTQNYAQYLENIQNLPQEKLSGKHLVHRVSSGQTLSGIARSYGVSVSQILAMNSLESKSFIRTGQKLLIPVE